MKNFLILFFLLSSISAFAQKKVAEYHSDFYGKDFNIAISTDKNDPSTISRVYITVAGERLDETVMLEYSHPILLLSSLKEIRNKYAEWIKVAEDNHITDMTKEIPIKMPLVTVCWHGSKWHFAFNQRINFDFMILEGGKKIIVMHTEVTDTTNEYINQKFFWIFQSVEELDNFIKKLDYSKFIEQINEKVNKADLFQ